MLVVFHFLLGGYLIKYMIFFVVKYHLFKISCAIQIVFVEFIYASVCFYRFIRELKNRTTRKMIFITIFLYLRFS